MIECPCCGQTLPPPTPLFPDAQLTVKQAQLFERIVRAGKHGIHKDSLLSFLYGDREDGGPDPKILDVLQCHINKKIRPNGFKITSHMKMMYFEPLGAPSHRLSPKRKEPRNHGK